MGPKYLAIFVAQFHFTIETCVCGFQNSKKISQPVVVAPKNMSRPSHKLAHGKLGS